MAVDREAWNGRRVLVTGHTGFKGSWLTLWLEALGARVTGLSLGVPTRPSLFEFAGISRRVHSLEGDVRDFEAVHEAVALARPDVIFHMAAQPLASLVGGSAHHVRDQRDGNGQHARGRARGGRRSRDPERDLR